MAGETEKWRKIYLIDKLLTKKYLTEVLKYLKMYNFIFERRLLTSERIYFKVARKRRDIARTYVYGGWKSLKLL